MISCSVWKVPSRLSVWVRAGMGVGVDWRGGSGDKVSTEVVSRGWASGVFWECDVQRSRYRSRFCRVALTRMERKMRPSRTLSPKI